MIAGWENSLVLAFFSILMGAIALTPSAFSQLRCKSWDDWVLDLSGLCTQGIVIPLLQITVVYSLYHFLLPNLKGCWHLHPLLSFGISFILVDYLYYWNHRLLHHSKLWRWHRVHHTLTHMDVLGTSRNTVWTSFLIIYLWIHPLWIYLLNDPTSYLIGVSLTSGLDLWRHSSFYPQGWLYKCLSPWLILPQDHTQHHASQSFASNYGANFKLWDYWHGTYRANTELPIKLGIETHLSLREKLFYPLMR
jgi:sterol desaturase/sphingolipid hydroxylase (fatty acid hydroxylase superfamily)